MPVAKISAPAMKGQLPSHFESLMAGWTNSQAPCSEPLTRLKAKPMSISSTGIGLLTLARWSG